MKSLSLALLLAMTSMASYAAIKTIFPPYLVVLPSSTLETEFGAACVRVTNISKGLVYLPPTTADAFHAALDAFPGVLAVKTCAGK